MFKFRAIGFTLLICLLGAIFFWRPWGELLYLVSAPAMAAAAVYECAKMLHDSGRKNYPRLVGWIFYAAALMTMLGWSHWIGSFYLISHYAGYALVLFMMILPLIFCALLLRKEPDTLEKILHSLGILALLAPTLLCFLSSFYIRRGGAPVGAWLFFLCLVTKATDTGGYIVGTLTSKLPGGNHKIAPGISPKKSWEGLIGGMILSLLTGWLFARFAGYVPLWWYLTAAFILSLGSFFGDLAESAVKRLCNIKDSGHWVPGMGGAFDVLDSFIFNGILFFLLILLV